MSALLELSERCEQATGPDRALDYDIAHFATRAHLANHGKAPAYTSSLDAAMTLVPEGLQWTIEPSAAWIRWLDSGDPSGVGEAQAQSKTTALALCAAALRARAVMAEVDTPPAP